MATWTLPLPKVPLHNQIIKIVHSYQIFMLPSSTLMITYVNKYVWLELAINRDWRWAEADWCRLMYLRWSSCLAGVSSSLIGFFSVLLGRPIVVLSDLVADCAELTVFATSLDALSAVWLPASEEAPPALPLPELCFCWLMRSCFLNLARLFWNHTCKHQTHNGTGKTAHEQTSNMRTRCTLLQIL